MLNLKRHQTPSLRDCCEVLVGEVIALPVSGATNQELASRSGGLSDATHHVNQNQMVVERE